MVDDLAVDVQDEPGYRHVRVLRRGEVALRPGEARCAEGAYVSDPRIMTVVELAQGRFGGAWVVEHVVIGGWAVEVGCGGWPEHGDEMRQPPGDRGDGLAVVRRRGVVHGELAGTERHRRCALGAAGEGPALGNRLPEVFVVGQPVEPGSELTFPVPLELIEEFGVPVDVHASTLEIAIIRAACHTPWLVLSRRPPISLQGWPGLHKDELSGGSWQAVLRDR